RFSDPYDPATVPASALRVNGIAADARTLTTATTITFTFTSSPVTVQGLQTMDIAAGAIHRLRDQGPVRAFHAEFRYDAIRMQIDATVPANGSVLMLPPTTVNLDVHFNEPYDPATVRTNNLTLSQGSVTAASVVNADTARYTLDLSSITSEGTLTI